MADFESVKILLSSRPIPACVQAFSKFPKLHLQDLTRDDIKHYVEDKLGQDNLMQRLNQVQGGATSQLVESLTSKASGVFLWVCFVGMERLLFHHPLSANFSIEVVKLVFVPPLRPETILQQSRLSPPMSMLTP